MRTNCWWRLSGYVMRHRRDLLLGFGAALAGTVIAVLVPLVTKRVIDDAIAADHRPLAPWAVVLVRRRRGDLLADVRTPVLRRSNCPPGTA